MKKIRFSGYILHLLSVVITEKTYLRKHTLSEETGQVRCSLTCLKIFIL
jgi:hypothetical protein